MKQYILFLRENQDLWTYLTEMLNEDFPMMTINTVAKHAATS